MSAIQSQFGQGVQAVQTDIAGGHVQRPGVVLGQPRQRLLVAAVVDVVHQLVGPHGTGNHLKSPYRPLNFFSTWSRYVCGTAFSVKSVKTKLSSSVVSP